MEKDYLTDSNYGSLPPPEEEEQPEINTGDYLVDEFYG